MNEDEVTKRMQLRQSLIAAIVRPDRVLQDSVFETDIEGDLVECRQLVIRSDSASSTADSMPLQDEVQRFAKAHGLNAEDMIVLLAGVLHRYTGFAALEVLERQKRES